jgi:hypothetical protein
MKYLAISQNAYRTLNSNLVKGFSNGAKYICFEVSMAVSYLPRQLPLFEVCAYCTVHRRFSLHDSEVRILPVPLGYSLLASACLFLAARARGD